MWFTTQAARNTRADKYVSVLSRTVLEVPSKHYVFEKSKELPVWTSPLLQLLHW